MLQGTELDLVELHFEPRSHFNECDIFWFLSSLVEDVMAEGNEVITVGERHQPSGVFFGDRKEVFENIAGSGAELGSEIVEEEVRKSLGDGSSLFSRSSEVMSHHDVAQV